LDLSQNELAEVQGLGALKALTELNLSGNWFRELPREVTALTGLSVLNASRNFLRSSNNLQALRLEGLAKLKNLRVLDLRFNRKLEKQRFADQLAQILPSVTLRITISEIGSMPEGSFVGNSAADRDATLLRSQLEPWSTLVLRRRLVDDFGEEPTDPEVTGRAELMKRLLECYQKEDPRKTIRVDGMPLSTPLLAKLRAALREWAAKHHTHNRERPSIDAKCYMILRSPSTFGPPPFSKKVGRAASKYNKHAQLWELARQALCEVDSEYAEQKWTSLAVTKGFVGSPHIDKQNRGPFYGLSVGDFPEGQGGVCVECDARVVAHVNTRNRLGKVDGRFPHWVAPYGEDYNRYSLIFYQTDGEQTPKTTAIFAPAVVAVAAGLGTNSCEGGYRHSRRRVLLLLQAVAAVTAVGFLLRRTTAQ
jgi:hypothetical protein